LAGAAFHLKNLHAEFPSRGRRLVHRRVARTLIGALCTLGATATVPTMADEQTAGAVASFRVVGDGIPDQLAGVRGSAERGRALLVEREAANCLLCHAIADPSMRVAGNIGPSLDGIGSRLSAAQLRLRVADIQRVNSSVAMPSYYRVEGLNRIAAEYSGKPILDARQVEDIVAYLETLK
jgi:L-cysteine S-thiosulfotransferase